MLREHLQSALDALVDLAINGDEGAKTALEWAKQSSDSGEIVTGLPTVPSHVLELLSEVGRSAEVFTMSRMIAHFVETGEVPSHLTFKVTAEFESLR